MGMDGIRTNAVVAAVAALAVEVYSQAIQQKKCTGRIDEKTYRDCTKVAAALLDEQRKARG